VDGSIFGHGKNSEPGLAKSKDMRDASVLSLYAILDVFVSLLRSEG